MKRITFLLFLLIPLLSFHTKSQTFEADFVTDMDGNTYRTIKIGEQWWMAENLKVTQYADGTRIPNVTDNKEWGKLKDNNKDKAYCFYLNDEGLGFGALYTYAAATNDDNTGLNVQGACPDGWHIPNDEEWKTLEMEMGLSQSGADRIGFRGETQGKDLKAIWRWETGEKSEDPYGFSALPGGCRIYKDGDFRGAGIFTSWWSSTPSKRRYVYDRSLDEHNYINRQEMNKSYGLSVRCVKD